MRAPDLSSSLYLTALAVVFVLALIAAFGALLWSYLARWREDRYSYDPLVMEEEAPDVELETAIALRRLAWEPEHRMDDAPPTITAANFCRSKHALRWANAPLHHIGRRAAKSYFAVFHTPTHQRAMAAVLRVRHCSPVDPSSPHFHHIAAMLEAAEHPNVAPCLLAQYVGDASSLVVVRPLLERGSLRDYLHGEAPPAQAFSAKYARRRGAAAPLERLALWGRHVLDALAFLRRGGLRVCNLHAGNVLLGDDGRALLSDLEADLAGAAPEVAVARQVRTVRARDAASPAARHAAADGADAPAEAEHEVLLFGQLLFELATGWRMETPHAGADAVGLDLPAPVGRVLRRIFDLSLPRRYRTLADLRRCSLFKRVDGFADAPRAPPWAGPDFAQAAAAATAVATARFALPGRYRRAQHQHQQHQHQQQGAPGPAEEGAGSINV